MLENSPVLSLSESELLEHPFVQKLYKLVLSQSEEIEVLMAELRELKKLPAKPNTVSKLDNDPDNKNNSNINSKDKKRNGSSKRSKTKDLPIHEEKIVKLDSPDQTWKFLGYREYVVQGITIRNHNVCYKREIWQTPDGKEIIAPLPVAVKGTHFSSELQSFIIYQYNHSIVTQPLLLEELRDLGIDISAGQLNNILTEKKDVFHQEAADILSVGLELSPEIRTDDTPSHHKGEKGFCNCINTDYFTYFKSSDSKSRINFLEVLSNGTPTYILNQEALSYLQDVGLGKKYFQLFDFTKEKKFKDKASWDNYLEQLDIVPDIKPHIYRKLTESVLIAGLLSTGFNKDMIIHSDDAGQFKLFVNSLCWKHAERPLKKLVCCTDEQRKLLDDKLSKFWHLYRDLKLYKLETDLFNKDELLTRFDVICEPVTIEFDDLNKVLKNLLEKKDELMLVIDRPHTSLENNPSERDIREFAKRRKINGPTKNDAGRKARDTFASLKKTCRKLGISFLGFVNDRVSKENKIPSLSKILTQKMAAVKIE